MGFRIVAWMERSGIQEGDMGRGGTACVNEETRITLCSIRATKGILHFHDLWASVRS